MQAEEGVLVGWREPGLGAAGGLTTFMNHL